MKLFATVCSLLNFQQTSCCHSSNLCRIAWSFNHAGLWNYLYLYAYTVLFVLLQLALGYSVSNQPCHDPVQPSKGEEAANQLELVKGKQMYYLQINLSIHNQWRAGSRARSCQPRKDEKSMTQLHQTKTQTTKQTGMVLGFTVWILVWLILFVLKCSSSLACPHVSPV